MRGSQRQAPAGGGPAARPLTVYVYFDVDPSVDAAVLRAALNRLAMRVARGGATMTAMRRLQTRRSAPPGTATWMEVHEGVDPAALGRWLERLEQAAAESGVAALAAGGRHVEVFETVDGPLHPPPPPGRDGGAGSP